MWRLLFFVIAAATFTEVQAQIPGSELHDVFGIDSRKDGTNFKAGVTIVEGRVGLMTAGSTWTGPLGWIAKPAYPEEPYELHGCWIKVDKAKNVLKTIDPEAIVYDLTGKDSGVYYRKPDERWGGRWKSEVHDETKAKGPNQYFEFCRATQGELTGYYLDFDEKPIKVPDPNANEKATFHPARLSKESTPWGRFVFEGFGRDGISP
jgi:hypothetical protein